MVIAGGIARAGVRPGAGIHAEFQPFCVEGIGEELHAAGEFFGVGGQPAGFVTRVERPAVVDDDVFIPGVTVSFFDHGVRRFQNQGLRNVGAERVPGIPTHGGTFCEHKNNSFLIVFLRLLYHKCRGNGRGAGTASKIFCGEARGKRFFLPGRIDSGRPNGI